MYYAYSPNKQALLTHHSIGIGLSIRTSHCFVVLLAFKILSQHGIPKMAQRPYPFHSRESWDAHK